MYGFLTFLVYSLILCLPFPLFPSLPSLSLPPLPFPPSLPFLPPLSFTLSLPFLPLYPLGQLGIAHSYSESTRPRQIVTPSGHHITQIACGANFSAALSGEQQTFPSSITNIKICSESVTSRLGCFRRLAGMNFPILYMRM